MPRVAQRREPARYALRGHAAGLLGRDAAVRARDHLHVDARTGPQKRARHAGLVARGSERHERGPERLGLLEDAVHERQHVGMAAEVVGQQDEPVGVRLPRLFDVAVIHGNVGATEAVDALLRVAHRAQTLAGGARHALDHVHLQLVGVLELVHHDQLEAVGVVGGQAG